jgi:hypothetical protein
MNSIEGRDSDGDNDDDDHTGTGQQRKAAAGTQGVHAHSTQEPVASNPQQVDDDGLGEAGGDPLPRGLTKGQRNDFKAIETLIASLGVSESWSGMLPRAEDFNAYSPEVQERICQWNDAFTTDESKRQDRLVDNEIRQSNLGTWISAFIFLLSIAFTFIAFMKKGNALSFGFLALPVLTMIGNLLTPVFSRSSVHDSRGNDQDDASNEAGSEG